MFLAFNSLRQMSNICMCCTYVVSGEAWILTQIHARTIGVTWFVTQSVNFYAKTFLFFGMYCLKITLPLNFTITSSTAKFLQDYRILHRPDSLCQILSVVSTVSRVPHVIQVSATCVQNSKRAVNIKIYHVPWSHRTTESKSRPLVMQCVFQAMSHLQSLGN